MPIGPPKFEDLLEAAPDAMVGTDASGVAVFANERAKALLGRDPVGEPLGELPAGARRHAHPMGDYELVVLRDADPRALRAVLDNTPAAIFLKDPDGRYLLVNRAFETPARQARRRDLLGRLDRDVLPPDISERMRVDDLRVMSDRKPIELQEEVRHGEHDADVPVGQVPADRRRRRRALRRRRRRHRHHPPQPARGAPARGAAAGGGRPARGRRRARLQQPAGGDRQLRAVRAQGARPTARARRATWTRSSPPRGARSELTRRLLLFSRRQSGTPEVLSLRRVIEGVELLLQRTLGDEHRPQGRLRRAAVGRRGRPQPARAGADEPGAELARGDARRRRADDQGRERGHARPGEPELARRAADGGRHRPRDGARGHRARLRAVLHHQGRLRPRRRARAGDGLRDRHQRARADRARVRAGRGHDRHRAAARGPPRERRRTVAERAARARRDRAGGRGRRRRAGVDRPDALRRRLPGRLGRVAARWRWSAWTPPTCS